MNKFHNRKVSPAISFAMMAVWVVVGILVGVFVINHGKKTELDTRASAEAAQVEVTNVRYDSVGTEPYLAPPDLKFAIVDLKVKNSSPDIFHFAPVLQTKVIDEAGQEWPMAPATQENPINAGPVSVGTEITGTVSYLVPIDSQTLKFVFTPIVKNAQESKYTLGQ